VGPSRAVVYSAWAQTTALPRVASGSLAAALRVRGKDASPRPLQTNLHHEHSWLRSTSSRERGVKRRLTALLPLWPAGLAALAEARVARRSVPCSASGASSGTPPGTGLSAVREASGSASDALCRARCRSSSRTSLPGARTAAPAPLVKEGGASRSSAPFHRRRAPSTPACAGASGAARRLPAIDTIHEHDRVDPTEPCPERVRLPSPAGAWRQRSCEHRRPALLGPGGRERLSPHRPRPGIARRSYPETDPCRAPRFMSSVPRSGWRSRPRAASPPRERAHPRASLSRDPRRHATHRSRGRSDSRFWPRPDHVTEGRPPDRPREGETRLAAPEVPSGR